MLGQLFFLLFIIVLVFVFLLSVFFKLILYFDNLLVECLPDFVSGVFQLFAHGLLDVVDLLLALSEISVDILDMLQCISFENASISFLDLPESLYVLALLFIIDVDS